MTNEKAIQELNNLCRCICIEKKPTKCIKCPLPIAIDCIEKQMPQEVTMYGDDYADGNEVIEYYECPRCGMEYVIEDDGFFKHCPECGRALKCEGVEDDK